MAPVSFTLVFSSMLNDVFHAKDLGAIIRFRTDGTPVYNEEKRCDAVRDRAYTIETEIPPSHHQTLRHLCVCLCVVPAADRYNTQSCMHL